MICNQCNNDLPEENFSWRNKSSGKRNNKCKSCHREYVKEHYNENKKEYIDRAKLSKKVYVKRNQEFLSEIKDKLKCSECFEDHPAVLDFHHIDPIYKEKNVSRMIYDGVSIKNIEKEIDKCIVLCSNCHRKLHWNERNSA